MTRVTRAPYLSLHAQYSEYRYSEYSSYLSILAMSIGILSIIHSLALFFSSI